MIELTNLSTKEMKKIRKNFQMLFQDVYSSLDTRMKISKIVTEPLDIHNIGTRKDRIDRAKELMLKVGLCIHIELSMHLKPLFYEIHSLACLRLTG